MKGKPSAIILVGFSTTGKTQVGSRVARLLGWDYVDTDAEIEKMAGKPIPKVFAQDGEPVFRELEKKALLAACQRERVVIATGGGAVLDPGNRELMSRRGMVVCLDAEPGTIYERLRRDAENPVVPVIRPLLEVPDPLRRIQELKSFREPFYAFADFMVKTDNLNVEEASQEVVRHYRLWGGRALLTLAAQVQTASHSYAVQVGWGCLGEVGRLLRERGLGGRAVLVSDQAVAPLYEGAVRVSLEAAGLSMLHYEVPSGEASKTLESASRIYDFLVEHRVERGDFVVALGGGVVGDLAGFVAATFLRGLPWVVLPTSLMAMTDASIGGKVAVNHPRAKNLIGAFHQPELVLADAATLTTLPPRELTSGWAEVIKHGLTLDTSLLEMLESRVEALRSLEPEVTVRAIALSAAAKAGVVNQDERETGLRRVLNYGHTIGHGLEAATDYGRFLHGEAVAIGMMGAARLSQRLGLVGPGVVARQEGLLLAFGLPTCCPGVDRRAVERAMELDKKSREGEVRWVLLTGLGHPDISGRPVPRQEVTAVLEELVRP